MRFIALFLRMLAAAHPAFVAALYGVLIILFALVYSRLPRDFYHSSVKYEEGFRRTRAELGRSLMNALEAGFSPKPDLGGDVTFQFVVGPVNIRGEQDGYLAAVAQIAASAVHADGGSALYFLNVPLIISPVGIKGREDQPNKLATVYVKVDGQRPIEDVSVLAHKLEDRQPVAKAVEARFEQIQLDAEQRRLVDAVLNAEMGFPHSVAGSVARMLYFSAITIATVGYGDVLPLTGRARFLAGLEATIGIFLLGVLVNGFGKWASSKTDSGDKE